MVHSRYIIILNVKKAFKCTFFNKTVKTSRSSNSIERTFSIKFLGVILDENITRKDHIHITEKKIAKILGSLYRAKQLLNEESLKIIYFPYIHSNLNYANVAWAIITYCTKLKTIHYQQKHAVQIKSEPFQTSFTIAKCFRCLSNKFVPISQFYVQI